MKGCRIEIYDWGSGFYLVADRNPLGGCPVQGVANSRPSPAVTEWRATLVRPLTETDCRRQWIEA